MSEQTIQEALKQAGAPDYMVLIITKIVSAEDAIREMQASLSKRAVELHQRESALEDQRAVLEDQRTAFIKAAKDMNDFANRIYGPDSELSQVNEKLAAAAQRDAQLEKLVSGIELRVAVLENARKSA